MTRTEQMLRNEAAEQVRRFASYPGAPQAGSSEREELITAFIEAAGIGGRAKLIGDWLIRHICEKYAPTPKQVFDAALDVDREYRAANPVDGSQGPGNAACSLCQGTGFSRGPERMNQMGTYKSVQICACREAKHA